MNTKLIEKKESKSELSMYVNKTLGKLVSA